jgi:hypothetical protein
MKSIRRQCTIFATQIEACVPKSHVGIVGRVAQGEAEVEAIVLPRVWHGAGARIGPNHVRGEPASPGLSHQPACMRPTATAEDIVGQRNCHTKSRCQGIGQLRRRPITLRRSERNPVKRARAALSLPRLSPSAARRDPFLDLGIGAPVGAIVDPIGVRIAVAHVLSTKCCVWQRPQGSPISAILIREAGAGPDCREQIRGPAPGNPRA